MTELEPAELAPGPERATAATAPAELTDADMRGCRWIEGNPTPLRPGSVALRRCRAAHGVPSIERSSGPTGEPRAGPRQHERVSASPTDLERTAVPVGARGHGLGCADASMGAAARMHDALANGCAQTAILSQ
jgi:hypothetical protein